MILRALGTGHIYGYTVMEVTGLPSGTVYPALRRLERDQLIRSHWERQSLADAALRPPRKYYKLTPSGEAALDAARKRYPLLAKLNRPHVIFMRERESADTVGDQSRNSESAAPTGVSLTEIPRPQKTRRCRHPRLSPRRQSHGIA
jgi:DNA-binding PadR family transcriptional regulator